MSKNKFKLKHVALGLALVGYMSATALALDVTTTTASSINGRAPVIKSAVSKTDGKITINFLNSSDVQLGDDEKLSVGDKIQISYILTDADGDLQGTNGTASTFELWADKDKNGKWEEVENIKTVTGGKDDGASTLTITYTVDAALLGTKRLGMLIQEKTSYGLPSTNRWLSIADLTAVGTDPGTGTDRPDDPGTGTGPGDGNTGGGIGDGGITPPATGIGYGIFLAGDVADGKDLTVPADGVTPVLGNTYTARVWDKGKDGTNTVDTEDSDVSNLYKYQWSLVDNTDATSGHPAAGNVGLTGAELTLTGETGQTITFTDNSQYKAIIPAGNNAGIQGYKLKVKIYN